LTLIGANQEEEESNDRGTEEHEGRKEMRSRALSLQSNA
jgi:hypothetical protein